MDARKEIIAALELMQQPAFFVESGLITHQNTAAGKFLLDNGTKVASLIVAGGEEYEIFTAGQLHLTVELGGIASGCCITKVESGEIWMPTEATEQEQLQAIALAAQVLREPLSAAMSAADQLFPALADDPQSREQTAQINRRLFQMLRTIGNMSDAALYAEPQAGRMEYVEICEFIREILDKTGTLTADTGIHMEIDLPNEAIYTLADTEKLERAVYNLLSNAIKFSPAGSTVQVRLANTGKRLRFSVTNEGEHASHADYFTQFLRQPGLYDSRWGLGLGMVLVRTTAAIHGGTVLVDHTDASSSRITMTLALQQPKTPQLRSPILHIDYAGERDHGLIELADVLPPKCYGPENIH